MSSLLSFTVMTMDSTLASMLLIQHSHYMQCVPQLEVLLASRTASKDAKYLPRFGVSFTLQAV